MSGLAEEVNGDLDENIVRKYYGSKSLGGIDLLVFNQLFKQPNVNGKIFISKIDQLLKKFESYEKTPIWMVKISFFFVSFLKLLLNF
jgi:hypothetical protein